MIEYQQIGPHLFREDAYREYCWSVDAYSAYQPASFIYLCFERFRDLLAERGVLLMRANETLEPNQAAWRYQRDGMSDGPFLGFMGRVDSEASVTAMQNSLRQGRNVLALLPNEIAGLYGYMKGQDDIDKHQRFLSTLGLDAYSSKLSPKILNKKEVWWEEVETSEGRLFITEDSFVSDAYFMDGYGKSDSNTAAVCALADAFSTHSVPLVHVSWENQLSQWVCNEPYTFHLRVRNLGPTLETVSIELEIPNDAEPMSTLTFQIPALAPLRPVSLAVQVEFRNAGEVLPIQKVSARNGGGSVATSLDCRTLEVVPSTRGLALKHASHDSSDFSRFLAVAKAAGGIVDLENIQELAKIDVEAALNKLRKAGERLAIHVLKKHNPKMNLGVFSECIREIQNRKLLNSRSIGYFHTLRVLGNLASHPNDSQLSDADVRVGAYALAAVLEEIIERNYL